MGSSSAISKSSAGQRGALRRVDSNFVTAPPLQPRPRLPASVRGTLAFEHLQLQGHTEVVLRQPLTEPNDAVSALRRRPNDERLHAVEAEPLPHLHAEHVRERPRLAEEPRVVVRLVIDRRGGGGRGIRSVAAPDARFRRPGPTSTAFRRTRLRSPSSYRIRNGCERSSSRPAWAPPSSLFGPVWSVLYLLMAIAAWLVWKNDGFRQARGALGFFLAQLVANALWTWIFFAWRQGAAALGEIVLLWILIVATIVAFSRFSRLAAGLLVPYLLWVTFASALNFAVWRLNGLRPPRSWPPRRRP